MDTTTKKRGVGFMDVMDFAIGEMDDAKRKKVIHYAMRKLQDTENELQNAVKCGEVAKVAKGRAVERAQVAEDRVQVLDGVLGLVYEGTAPRRGSSAARVRCLATAYTSPSSFDGVHRRI